MLTQDGSKSVTPNIPLSEGGGVTDRVSTACSCVRTGPCRVDPGQIPLCALAFASERCASVPQKVIDLVRSKYTLKDPHSPACWRRSPLAADGVESGPATQGGTEVVRTADQRNAQSGFTKNDHATAASLDSPLTVEGASSLDTYPAIGGFLVLGSGNLLTDLPELFCAPSTFSLDLSNNKISAVPTTLCNMTNVTAIDLRNNALMSLPHEGLTKLTRLKYLNLRNNRLAILPPMPQNLEELQLGENQIECLRSAFPHRMLCLKVLVVSGNKLTAIPAAVSMLSRLEELDARSNQIAKLAPQIGSLSHLKRLILFGYVLTHCVL
eukprot:m.191585 g.191585  ORF g.191585 m.191585 type:complete len:324 (-) comp15150_c0_seq2:504-1475(-)